MARRGDVLLLFIRSVSLAVATIVSGISGPREESPRIVGKDNENEDARGSTYDRSPY